MKFLILFAVAAVFGSVHCDVECFRGVFKECQRDNVPLERLTLCDEIQYQVTCFSRVAYKCNMPFKVDADELKIAVMRVCRGDGIQKWFDEEKACYKKAVNDSVCTEPINEALRDFKTPEDFIRANKKVCNLFEPYSNCVEDKVEKNCGRISQVLFNWLYNPMRKLSNSLCEQLILPADEKDGRPDNFGMLNVYASVAAIFISA
ncbi:hypothetical protein AVEN_110066-1 [Araneus ventricosus]|uniref:DUF19 domain-containing protein n=1 Tax=Araneus ventricosus TaxID=182803 RepID=A0A4Y2SAC0_ARAVE|nr:hypothetical protein AVEN_110066-1 [Araneus ventricosus]